MRYQIDLIWISSIWATGSQKKWRHTDSVFDFVVETLDSLLSVWSVWSYIIRIKFVFCQSSQYCPKHLFSFMTCLGSLQYISVRSIATVSWQYLLISPLSDDGMWLAVQRLRTVSAEPHLAWPHNFSTSILNSDQLRLSRQKIGRSRWAQSRMHA